MINQFQSDAVFYSKLIFVINLLHKFVINNLYIMVEKPTGRQNYKNSPLTLVNILMKQ